jgi:hypothetical protein
MGLFCLSWLIYPCHSLASLRVQVEAVQAKDSDIEVEFQEQFSELYPVLLSIPEDKTRTNQNSSFPTINVDVINNTQAPICLSFSNLIPEILDSNGQALKRGKIENEVDEVGFWLEPGETFTLEPLISIFWQNNDQLMLVVQGLKLSSDGQSFHDNTTNDTFIVSDNHIASLEPGSTRTENIGLLENGWSFSGVQEGNYQLKFKYLNLVEFDGCNNLPLFPVQTLLDGEEHPFSETFEHGETGVAVRPNSMSLVSDFLPIRILRPLIDFTVVEVDGIRFETIISDQTLIIPPFQSDSEVTSVRIGLRITNNSRIPYRFERYRNFFVRLSGPDNQLLTPFLSRYLS